MLALDTSTQIYKPQNALPGVGGLAPAQAVPSRVAPLTPATATKTLGGPGGTPQPTPNVSLGFKPNLTPAVLNSPAAAAATPMAGSSTMGGPGGPPPAWGSLGSLGLLPAKPTPASVTNPAPASALPGGGNTGTTSPAPGGGMAPIPPVTAPPPPTAAPTTPVPGGGASAPMPNATTNLGYGTSTTIDPTHDLRSQVIAPGSESNRLDLANQEIANYEQQQLAPFQSDLRKIADTNAGEGRLGSGMYNTDIGNLDIAEQNALHNFASGTINTALNNQITDNANQRAELRGERAYQTGQAQTASDQALQDLFAQDQLTQDQFNRDLATSEFGYSGNPATLFGAMGTDLGNTAAREAAGAGATSSNNQTNDLLAQIFGGGSGGDPNATGDILSILQQLGGGGVPVTPQVPIPNIPGVSVMGG